MTIVKRKTRPKSNDGPPIEVTPVSQIESCMAALFYGKSGTGKTTLASTFPKPILLLDIRENGWDSIANVSGIDVGSIRRWEQLEETYWWLQSGKTKYKTVILDHVTAAQDLALRKSLLDNGKKETDALSKRDFGTGSGLMKTWLLNYRDLIDSGINVVFLAHDRTRDGEETEDNQIDPSIGPLMMPSVASFLNGSVKAIGHTFIRETTEVGPDKRRKRKISFAMRVGPHAYYVTKARALVGVEVPQVIVNPTYDKLVAVMRGDYSEEATTVKRKK